MLKDIITVQEGASVLVAKVRFEDKRASFKKFYRVRVAPSSWQADFPDCSCAGKGTQVVWECHSVPGSYMSSPLHWQRSV